MLAARRAGRYGHRDATLIWSLIGMDSASRKRCTPVAGSGPGHGRLHVHRLKDGMASVHPLRGPELRALRRLERQSPRSPYVFISERGSSLTDSAVRKIVARAGRSAGLEFPIHPHMLRHAAGYKLANDGHVHFWRFNLG